MNNMKKLLFKSLILIFAASSVMTSCVGLDEVWDRIDTIEAKLDSIQNDLNAQVDALSSLLSDGSTIASCTKNADGSYVVKLSNGTEFTVLPAGTDVSALIAYKTVGGERYWATYNAAGELEILKDASGNGITVENTVNVEVTDGKYYLVINGKKYQTGFDTEDVVQVFSSCETHTDASGQVYAMTFTFGDGQKVTVTVDGYKGVIFKLSNVGATAAVTEYYIGYGEAMTFLMDVEDVIDYVMQIPDGWRVNEYVEELTGETYVDITAPAESVVAAGAAVSKGDLKVVSVVEGGKAAVTKLSLSTDPFKVYNVSSTKAVITPTNGIQKYAYGMMNLSDFDQDQLVAKINSLLSSSSNLPAGYYIGEAPLDKSLSEIYGAELEDEGEYVFWAIPALYTEGTDGTDAGFYVVAEMLRTKVLAPISVKAFEISDITVLGANLKVSVSGTMSMYAGIMQKSETALDDVVYQINNGIAEPVTILTYNGPAADFPVKESGIELDPDTEYLVWVVPVEAGKESYLKTDVIKKEFKTLAVTSGGTQAVTMGTPVADCSSITVPVSSEGASMIYYAWLNDNDGSRLSEADNESKMSQMQSSDSFTVLKTDSGEASIDFIKPETTMWLFAAAVAPDGKCGEVVCKSAVTESVTFNDLTVSVTDPVLEAGSARFTVSVSGGTAIDYLYWCGKETDPFWLYEEYCDASRTGAEVYMAANPDSEAILNVMRKNGNVGTDGTITITDMSLNTTYVFVILAKDADGNYSRGTMKKFNTPAADLGNMVTSNDEEWKSTKKWIEDNILWHKDTFKTGSGSGQGFGYYSFDIKTPADMTSYITCYSTDATNTIDIILEIEKFCSRSWDRSISIGEDIPMPTWINELDGREVSTGGVFNYFVRYLHGEPDDGYVTYFPESGHTDCISMTNGECSAYQKFKEEIAEKCSFEYWYELIKDFANQEKYGRKQSDDSIIRAAAQEYADLYYEYFHDAEPIIYINDGNPLTIINQQATGLDETGNVIEKVTVVLKDAAGNYYEPMYIDVPNYFK